MKKDLTIIDPYENELYTALWECTDKKPKGVVHTVGGYMVFTYYSFLNVFQYSKDDVY